MQQINTVFLWLMLILSVVIGGGAHAAESRWLATDFAKIRLISSSETAGLGGTQQLALEFRLEEGWKTYWRTPGDAGLPPQIFVDPFVSPDVDATLQFPLPKRFQLFGLDTFGYEGRVILPLTVTVPEPEFGLRLAVTVDSLICSDICVPVSGPLELDLPPGAFVPSIYGQDIAMAAAQVPRKRPQALTLQPYSQDDTSGLLATFTAATDAPVRDILLEGPIGTSFGIPEPSGDGYFIAQLSGDALASDAAITATVDAGSQFFETDVRVGGVALSSEAVQQTSSLPLWLIAFLGGVILNFMPCVLPVLSLKVASVIQLAGATRSLIRRRFLASAAGIISSFLILAAGLAAFRFAGAQIGWGIQFQNPIFLGVMAVIMGLFTLSLFDMVTFRTPAFAAKMMPARSSSPGLLSDFGAGMLATLLATPCSAPFVGTAVSFGLSQSDVALFGIMLMMGLGLASPWLLLALMPQAISILPKPGAWMIRLKQVLGLAMAATFIWIGALFVQAIGGSSQNATEADYGWKVFSEAALAEAQDAGATIFIDVTADWCITCQANKALVLNAADMKTLLAERNVVMMQADWTLPDDEISRYLARYNRFGIPFNIVYGPAEKEGVILPEILTKSSVKKALDRAVQ